jgi:hypothetical protein
VNIEVIYFFSTWNVLLLRKGYVGKALPFSGNTERLPSPKPVVPIFPLVEMDEHKVLTNLKFYYPFLFR